MGDDEDRLHMKYLRDGLRLPIHQRRLSDGSPGEIGLLHALIDTFVPAGARKERGTIVPAHLVVLATGASRSRFQQNPPFFSGRRGADKIAALWAR